MGYVDLHCHFVPAIDDGVRTEDEGVELLRGLAGIGFERVVATPHMRPGMFDNHRGAMEVAFATMSSRVASEAGMPAIDLASEHWFDDVVFARLVAGEGAPYPGGHAALIELNPDMFPVRLANAFFELRRRKIRPVLAHPERYAPVWSDHAILDPLLDGGTLCLLDVAALVGKYGRKPEHTARRLLEDGYYYAACSDAHRPADVALVARGIDELRALMGAEETDFLLGEGPRNILSGKVES